MHDWSQEDPEELERLNEMEPLQRFGVMMAYDAEALVSCCIWFLVAVEVLALVGGAVFGHL